MRCPNCQTENGHAAGCLGESYTPIAKDPGDTFGGHRPSKAEDAERRARLGYQLTSSEGLALVSVIDALRQDVLALQHELNRRP